jgi:hypothetical protein
MGHEARTAASSPTTAAPSRTPLGSPLASRARLASSNTAYSRRTSSARYSLAGAETFNGYAQQAAVAYNRSHDQVRPMSRPRGELNVATMATFGLRSGETAVSLLLRLGELVEALGEALSLAPTEATNRSAEPAHRLKKWRPPRGVPSVLGGHLSAWSALSGWAGRMLRHAKGIELSQAVSAGVPA